MDEADFHDTLRTRIYESYPCSLNDADHVARAALEMRRAVESEPGGLDDLEVTIDLVLDKLATAPGQLSLVGKWNWWAGTIGTIDDQDRTFKIQTA